MRIIWVMVLFVFLVSCTKPQEIVPVAPVAPVVVEQGPILQTTDAPQPPDPTFPETLNIDMKINKAGITPDGYVLHVNDTVNILLTSSDDAYKFSIPEYNLEKEVPALGTATISFVADKSGTFSYTANSLQGKFYIIQR